MGLLLHCGGKNVGLEDLRNIPLPDETNTYVPVSHYDLAVNLAEVAGSMLPGFTLDRSNYGIAREGKQLFGVHTFRNSCEDMGLSIGFRNSYDKSLSVGIAIGASVFVCDNMALTGEVTIVRKHTANVWRDVEEMAITTIYRSRNNFHQIVDESRKMQGIPVVDNQAYQFMGLLYGTGILTPRQLPVVRREWLTPSYPEFESRNLWSLYNACTEALKSTPPNKIMERHIGLHKLALGGAV